MTMVSCVMIGSFTLNYMTAKSQVEDEIRDALLYIAQSETIITPWHVSLDVNTISIPFFAMDLYYTGQVVAIWDEYYLLTEDHLLRIANEIVTENHSHGTIPSLNLRYVCEETNLGFRIICSDLSFETQILQGLLNTSFQIAILALLILLIISVVLSNLLLKPVAQAWEQQKQFVADASHELKTPLTVILSSAELLQTQIQNEKQEQWLENITEESQRMRRLIDDMLTLTKVQGEFQYDSEQIPFSDLVEKTILMLEPIAFEKKLFLQDTLTETLYVQGDKDRLQQLMMILLDNAIKYSPPNQIISISLCKEQGRSLLLTVSNPSEPISPQGCQQLFHRFYRQDASRSQQPGYGLGLSIAQSIVHGHGGKIWATYQEPQLHISVKLPLG